MPKLRGKVGRPPVPYEEKRMPTTFMLSRKLRAAFIRGAVAAGFANRSTAVTCLIEHSLENDGELLRELVGEMDSVKRKE